MKLSIIVPSFNQELFIADTLKNLVEIKQKAIEKGIGFEILIFDSESNKKVQDIITEFKGFIDFIEIKKVLQ
mgnify:FL=1